MPPHMLSSAERSSRAHQRWITSLLISHQFEKREREALSCFAFHCIVVALADTFLSKAVCCCWLAFALLQAMVRFTGGCLRREMLFDCAGSKGKCCSVNSSSSSRENCTGNSSRMRVQRDERKAQGTEGEQKARCFPGENVAGRSCITTEPSSHTNTHSITEYTVI